MAQRVSTTRITVQGCGIRLISVILTGICLFGRPPFALANDPLVNPEERIRAHTKKILEKLSSAEDRARAIIVRGQKDAVGKQYSLQNLAIDGPKEHPWIEANPDSGANPNAVGDYLRDSFVSASGTVALPKTWSCFEPQLIAKGWWSSGPDIFHPASADLAFACKMSCPPLPPPLPDNGYEVIQFWWPEHHIAVNNYARSRFNPALGGPHGSNYLRRTLLSAKRSVPDKIIKQQLEENYPLSTADLKELEPDDPFLGQSMWGGSPGDTGDRMHGHVYRTLLSVALGNRQPRGPDFFAGWLENPRSIYLSLAPPSAQKPIANLWTEYGIFEAITAVPQMSYLIGARGSRAMQALFDPKMQVSEKARNDPGFFQRTGSTAFRIARWPRDYGALRQVAEIAPTNNSALRETVFHGGQELFPLTLTLETFENPNTSTYAVMARRTAYLAGARELAGYLPGGEQSRMNEFTIQGLDPGTEVDKMQRIFPVRGAGPTECYRSQRIPNMVEQTEDGWVQQNFPYDLMGYVRDDFGDSAYTYWNKRVACTCRVFGMLGGSWPMEVPLDAFGSGRGTGDRPYGRIEASLCEYPESTLPSGFSGSDRPPCPIGHFRYRKGLDDHV